MSLVLYVSVLSLDLLGLHLTPCTKTISQWISNLGAKAIKLLKENMVVLHDLGFIHVFLDMTQKHEQQKKKYDLEFIRIENFIKRRYQESDKGHLAHSVGRASNP